MQLVPSFLIEGPMGGPYTQAWRDALGGPGAGRSVRAVIGSTFFGEFAGTFDAAVGLGQWVTVWLDLSQVPGGLAAFVLAGGVHPHLDAVLARIRSSGSCCVIRFVEYSSPHNHLEPAAFIPAVLAVQQRARDLGCFDQILWSACIEPGTGGAWHKFIGATAKDADENVKLFHLWGVDLWGDFAVAGKGADVACAYWQWGRDRGRQVASFEGGNIHKGSDRWALYWKPRFDLLDVQGALAAMINNRAFPAPQYDPVATASAGKVVWLKNLDGSSVMGTAEVGDFTKDPALLEKIRGRLLVPTTVRGPVVAQEPGKPPKPVLIGDLVDVWTDAGASAKAMEAAA